VVCVYVCAKKQSSFLDINQSTGFALGICVRCMFWWHELVGAKTARLSAGTSETTFGRARHYIKVDV